MKRQEMKSATEKGCLHPHIKMFNKKKYFYGYWLLIHHNTEGDMKIKKYVVSLT